jgi:SNF2 family DNA or RNA helicase
MTALQTTAAPPMTLPVKTIPWRHQRDAFAAAHDETAFLLAHEMGCGKTLVAVALLEHAAVQSVLVLCPKSVLGVWPRELRAHGERRWQLWAGRVDGARGPLRNPSVARRAAALLEAHTIARRLGRPFAAVVNFDAAAQGDMARLLEGTPWDAIVLDESHRLKAPGGKQSRFAAKIAARCRARGGRVIALTGTPMPHTPLDLWAQFRALDGGARLGTSYHRFCRRFAQPEQVWVPGGVQRTVYKRLRDDRVAEFAQLTAPMMHQVRAADVLDLPAAVDTYRTTTLDPATQKVYDQLERDLIADLDHGVVTAANAMVLVLRLAQATSGFARNADNGQTVPLTDGPPEKARLLVDLLQDVPGSDPVVVFARFHEDLDTIRRAAEFTGRRYGELSGRRRDALTDDATLAPNVELAGVQLQSGGVGIDLTRARIGVYYSLDFNLGDHEQSRARLHRHGQQRPVTFVYLLAEDTIDRAVLGALRDRRNVITTILARLKGATS